MSDEVEGCYQCGSPSGSAMNLCPACIAKAGEGRAKMKERLYSSRREKKDAFEKYHAFFSDIRVRLILAAGILWCLWAVAIAVYESYMNATYVKPVIPTRKPQHASASNRPTPTPSPKPLPTRECVTFQIGFNTNKELSNQNQLGSSIVTNRAHQKLKDNIVKLKKEWEYLLRDVPKASLNWDQLLAASIQKDARQSPAIKKYLHRGEIAPAWLDQPNIITEWGCGENATLVSSTYGAVPPTPCPGAEPLGGIYFLNAQGAHMLNGSLPVRELSICDSGTFGYRASPISLLMDPAYDVDANMTVAQFPLEPGREGHWYIWKASDKSPLLVYDPQHTGNIVSADQLFGTWTFGGKIVGQDVAKQPWLDGYEALGKLDKNADKKLSGDELAPLALWFDSNRDGVSQFGEVKFLSDNAIVAIYYTPDKTDPVTHSSIATKGFERQINKDIFPGVSIDWRSFGAPSKGEVVSATLETGKNQGDATIITKAPEQDDSIQGNSELNGIWEWSSAPQNIAGMPELDEMRGFITFKELKDGTITLHSYSMFDVKGDIDQQVANFLSARFGKGKKIGGPGDAPKYQFDIRGASFNLSTEFTIDPVKKVLLATTNAKFLQQGREMSLAYTWTAKQLQD